MDMLLAHFVRKISNVNPRNVVLKHSSHSNVVLASNATWIPIAPQDDVTVACAFPRQHPVWDAMKILTAPVMANAICSNVPMKKDLWTTIAYVFKEGTVILGDVRVYSIPFVRLDLPWVLRAMSIQIA